MENFIIVLWTEKISIGTYVYAIYSQKLKNCVYMYIICMSGMHKAIFPRLYLRDFDLDIMLCIRVQQISVYCHIDTYTIWLIFHEQTLSGGRKIIRLARVFTVRSDDNKWRKTIHADDCHKRPYNIIVLCDWDISAELLHNHASVGTADIFSCLYWKVPIMLQTNR